MRLLFNDNINSEDVLKKYQEKIFGDDRFVKDINTTLISIEEKYYAYVFYDGYLQNHLYFIKNNETNESINGKLDINVSYSTKEFTLNNIKKTFANNEINEEPGIIYNKKEIDSNFKDFINKTLGKFLYEICDKHNVKPSNKVHIDIAPIEEFTHLSTDIYYEKIYEIHYRDKSRKNDYVTIFSAVTLQFYSLEYVENEEFIKYKKDYKRPIAYLPKEYLDYYYVDGFKTFISMNNKIKYSTEMEIFKKVKGNIEYLEYKLFKDYLYTGIYYFRIKKYLNKLSIDETNIKRKIYLSYLTLKHNKESGLFLYECCKLNLLPDNSIDNMIKLLKISYSLGSLDAKMYLYKHYSSSLYYDEKFVKKYS